MVPGADTEDRILDAAHAVFLRRGTAGSRMQEVADEAGVNKALLHYYFRSKDRLAQAVFERALRTLVPRVLEELRSEATLETKVRRVVSFYIDMLSANPFLPTYILGELTHHPERIQQAFEATAGGRIGQVGAEIRSTLGRQLEEAAADGRFRAMAPEEFVLNLLSLVIFPFAGRPLLSLLLGLDGDGFGALMERRKETLPEFILNAMEP
ncbi:MAG: TetR family transcriptional regulator [Gemmatimonadota bacterium]|jgi:TetR/AcrR family transcriptional regulator